MGEKLDYKYQFFQNKIILYSQQKKKDPKINFLENDKKFFFKKFSPSYLQIYSMMHVHIDPENTTKKYNNNARALIPKDWGRLIAKMIVLQIFLLIETFFFFSRFHFAYFHKLLITFSHHLTHTRGDTISITIFFSRSLQYGEWMVPMI